MTDSTETEKVRTSKEGSGRKSGRLSTYSEKVSAADEREAKAALRSSYSSRKGRRDRVGPDSAGGGNNNNNNSSGSKRMVSRKESSRNGNTTADAQQQGRRSHRKRNSKSKRQLKVDTSLNADGENGNGTPATAASTPSPGIRSNGDFRSPGQRKTPTVAKAKVASDNDPVPDFITQTDEFGNASTPRSQKAIESARVVHPTGPKPRLHVDQEGKLSEDEEKAGEQDVDLCTETLFDSLRLVCCCLMPDDSAAQGSSKSQANEPEAEVEERPRLLPKLHPDDHGKKCLVLDLDETLVHSSFRAVPGADFVIPVQIEDVVHFVYVAKRPGVDEFLTEMAKHYEIVIYTASLNKYADPLLDLLDPNRVIRTRLFRESCVYYEGNYVKDLSLLDRDLSQAIIVDNSPSSYIFHPENAIDCSSFIDDPNDRELDQIAAFLTGAKDVRDVRNVCRQWRDWPDLNLDDQ